MFDNNKKIIEEAAPIPSKPLRNKDVRDTARGGAIFI